MKGKVRRIQVDAATADLLKARSAALNMSVAAALAEIAGRDGIWTVELASAALGRAQPPAAAAAETPRAAETAATETATTEAERMSEHSAAGEPSSIAVPWEEVKAWIDSWGKPGELPRPKPRKA